MVDELRDDAPRTAEGRETSDEELEAAAQLVGFLGAAFGLRDDLARGLRFTHLVGEALRNELVACNMHLFGLVDLLIAKGVISYGELEERCSENEEAVREMLARVPPVRLAPDADKYDPEIGCTIDCASRLSVCRAVCCRRSFPLSIQDLTEGVIRWDYFRPYEIARFADGTCVHLGDDLTCTLYDQRPLHCRTFDCCTDALVWSDFDERTPSPELEQFFAEVDREAPDDEDEIEPDPDGRGDGDQG